MAGTAAAATVLAPTALAAGSSKPPPSLRLGIRRFRSARGPRTRATSPRSLSRDVPGRQPYLHHRPVRSRGGAANGAARGRAPAAACRGGRCRRRARECAGDTSVADRPADVHRPRGARARRDRARRRDVGPGHPRSGRGPGHGCTRTARRGALGRPRRRASVRPLVPFERSGRGHRSGRAKRLTVVRHGLAGRERPRPRAARARAVSRVHPPPALSRRSPGSAGRRSRRSATPGAGRSFSAAFRPCGTRERAVAPRRWTASSCRTSADAAVATRLGRRCRCLKIADAVGGKVPILFGSGVRTGTDVYRALALGADAVVIGRPYVHGLALGG